MKLSRKTALIALSTIAVCGGVLWMRSLASWRPQKIGKIPQGTSQYTYPYFLASDAETVMLIGHKFTTALNTQSGEQRQWPGNNSSPLISPHSPNWAFTLNKERDVEVRDLATGHLKRIFRWPKARFGIQFVFDSDGDHIGVIEGNMFRQWSIATGRTLHQIHFDDRMMQGRFASYTVSSDGHQLIGCANDKGGIWDMSSGKCLHSWNIASHGSPSFFSDGAQVVAYIDTSEPYGKTPTTFVDTTTGTVRWKTSTPSLYFRTGDELVLLDATGCAILDINTGLPKRHLPGPRKGDQILRATPDYIYTLNNSHEILRWRAR